MDMVFRPFSVTLLVTTTQGIILRSPALATRPCSLRLIPSISRLKNFALARNFAAFESKNERI